MKFLSFLAVLVCLHSIRTNPLNTNIPSPYENDLVPVNLLYCNFFQDLSLTNGLDMLNINALYINSFGNIAMGDSFVNVTLAEFIAPDSVSLDPSVKSKLLAVNKVYLDFFGNLAKINGYTIKAMNKLYLDGFKQISFNTTSLSDFSDYFSEKVLPRLLALQSQVQGATPTSPFAQNSLPQSLSIQNLITILPNNPIVTRIFSLLPSAGLTIQRFFSFFPGFAFNSIDIPRLVERLASSKLDLTKLQNLNPGTAVEFIRDLVGPTDNANFETVIRIFEQIPHLLNQTGIQIPAALNQSAQSFDPSQAFNPQFVTSDPQSAQFTNQLYQVSNPSLSVFGNASNSIYADDLVPLNLMYLNFFQDLALTNRQDMLDINAMYVNTFGEIANGTSFKKSEVRPYTAPKPIELVSSDSKLVGVNRIYLDFFKNFGEINGNTLVEINRIYLDGFQQLRFDITNRVSDFGKFFIDSILPNITDSIATSQNFNFIQFPQFLQSGNFVEYARNLFLNQFNTSMVFQTFTNCNNNLTVGQIRANFPSQLNVCQFLSESKINVADVLARLPNPFTLCQALEKIPGDKKVSDFIPQLTSDITFGEIGRRVADSRINFCRFFRSLPVNLTLAEIYARIPKSINLCEFAADIPDETPVCQFMQQIQNNTAYFGGVVRENFVEFNEKIADQIRSNTNMTITQLLNLIPSTLTNAQFVGLFPDNPEFARAMSEMPSFVNLPQLLSVMPGNKTLDNLNKELPLWMNLATSMGLFGGSNKEPY